MASSSLMFSPLSSATTIGNRELSTGSAAKPRKSAFRRCGFKSPVAGNFDHIPKQFREENLKDGLMDNYKNTPEYLYGLPPSQLNMFMGANSPVRRQAEKVTEESLSSEYSYLNNGGMWGISGMDGRRPSKYSTGVSMYDEGDARGEYGTPGSPPTDSPSSLLDVRIVYLGTPITPDVTEDIISQFMWLDSESQTKPIYLYINSTGTRDMEMEMENVGFETDAYAIADAMNCCKAEVYTVNISMAFGQAAMLLSLGAKGHRVVQPYAITSLYLPKINRSSGSATNTCTRGKELQENGNTYVNLLAEGTGKPKEEIEKDIQRGKYFNAQDAIDYGIADKIIGSQEGIIFS